MPEYKENEAIIMFLKCIYKSQYNVDFTDTDVETKGA